MIAIVDYQAGNLASVQRALAFLGHDSVITHDPEQVSLAERIILPGVGAAGKAMSDLRRLGMERALFVSYEERKPILGICLGTQIILEKSEENNTACIGLIKGEVRRFPENMRGGEGRTLKVPHMGWNSVQFKKKHALFRGIDRDSEFYFVHSYYPSPSDPEIVLGETHYGFSFASVLLCKNLAAVQFHPEKSGGPGLRILSNFCSWKGKEDA
ncbi:MAG: imidazole glycerol phosphate synthase subunit HisH [Deltaproteobacteria bacterium]|nr:imidazole glycerol phosphate synthase subunit HisH [Deltaproteobacteria bacterium]